MLKFLVVIFLISSLFERNSAHAPANKLSDDALQETHLRVYAYEVNFEMLFELFSPSNNTI